MFTLPIIALLFHPQPVMQDDEGLLPMPGTLWNWSNWTWDLPITLSLAIFLVVYSAGAVRRGDAHR